VCLSICYVCFPIKCVGYSSSLAAVVDGKLRNVFIY
jgi:hypothetical protein